MGKSGYAFMEFTLFLGLVDGCFCLFKISNNIRIRIRKFSDLQIIFGFGFVKKKRFDHLWFTSDT